MMGVIVGFVVGYLMGAKNDPLDVEEMQKAWGEIRRSEEVRDIAIGGIMMMRQIFQTRVKELYDRIEAETRVPTKK